MSKPSIGHNQGPPLDDDVAELEARPLSNREQVRRDYVERHPDAAGLSKREIYDRARKEQAAAEVAALAVAKARAYTFDDVEAAREEGYAAGVAQMGRDYAALEALYLRNQARTHGYVVRTASDPPDKPVTEARGRGLAHRAYDFQMRNSWGHLQSRERVPYVLNEDGSWTRGKRCSVIKRTDYAQKIPPKVCENCKALFIAKRADAKTCSVACRMALHRKRAKLAHGRQKGRRA